MYVYREISKPKGSPVLVRSKANKQAKIETALFPVIVFVDFYTFPFYPVSSSKPIVSAALLKAGVERAAEGGRGGGGGGAANAPGRPAAIACVRTSSI